MRTWQYLYVRDLETGQVVSSYFVAVAGLDPADYPTDTTHGGIPPGTEQDFAVILERSWPAPRYRIEGGFAPSLAVLAGQWEALVEHDRPTFDDETDFLCAWDDMARRMVECLRVGDGPNPEAVPQVPKADKAAALAALRAKHQPAGLMVLEVTATSAAEAARLLGGQEPA